MTWDIIWNQDLKELGFRIHQKVVQSGKTLESQSQSFAVDGGHSCRIWAP